MVEVNRVQPQASERNLQLNVRRQHNDTPLAHRCNRRISKSESLERWMQNKRRA